MINVDMINNNNIVTIHSEGKVPIKSSMGYMFYSPDDLLCSAVGACIGHYIVNMYRGIGVTTDIIKSLEVYLNSDSSIGISIIFFKDVDKEIISNTVEGIKECPIAGKLSSSIDVYIGKVNENVVKKGIKGCCG